jgi:DNA-binding LacI/PurR family transcriptional regulator
MAGRKERKDFKRITLKDIAEATGVSYAAVSVVLGQKSSGTIRVSAGTRKRVLASAKKLGYVPNVLARALKGGRNSLIVVFTYEKVFPVDSRNEYYPFFVGIEAEAERQGFDLLILNNRPLDEGSTSKFSRILMADGAIMIGVHRVEERLRSLVNRNFPVVFVGRRDIPGCETSWVTFDYRGVIRDLLHYLAASGARDFLYVRTPDHGYEPYSDRENYLKEAAPAEGLNLAGSLEVPVAGPGPAEAQAIRGAKAVVFDRITTAIAFRELMDGNLGMPDDRIAVLEDDWTGQDISWTHWTSERQALGAEAVKLLVRIMAGTESQPSHNLVPLKVVPFGKAGP